MIETKDLNLVECLTLALLRATAWKNDPKDRPNGLDLTRSWKGYSFAAMRKLNDHGLVVDKPGSTPVTMTPAGVAMAEEVLAALGFTVPEIPVRSYVSPIDRLELDARVEDHHDRR